MKNLWTMKLRKMTMVMLVAAMAFMFTACAANDETEVEAEITTEITTEATTEATTEVETEIDAEAEDDMDGLSAGATVIGEGETEFLFTVTFEDATMHLYEVYTDATTVGEALVELGLIEGEDSEYGLYVKTVDGVTLDWDVDAAYWAFYIDGDMAATGVDSTEIVAGSTYTFAYAQ